MIAASLPNQAEACGLADVELTTNEAEGRLILTRLRKHPLTDRS